jgi:DNA-binding GntR family transcriptional regulator
LPLKSEISERSVWEAVLTEAGDHAQWHVLEMPNIGDVIYQMLRERILRYDFAPGERLDLNEIEASLKVSRTPLKDALKRLEAEGLVQIQARRGTFVAAISAETLDEAYKIRSAYELYVALCLFKYLTPADMLFFRQIRQQMGDLTETVTDDNWQEVMQAYLIHDQQLHERFVARGGTPKMLQLFQHTNVHQQVARIVHRYNRTDFEAAHLEHEQIFDALESRSPDLLNTTLLNHLENSRMRVLKNLRE